MSYKFDQLDAKRIQTMLKHIYGDVNVGIDQAGAGYQFNIFSYNKYQVIAKFSLENALFIVLPKALGIANVMYNVYDIDTWSDFLYEKYLEDKNNSSDKKEFVCQENEAKPKG